MSVPILALSEQDASKIIGIKVSILQKSRVSPYTNIINGTYPPFIKVRGLVRYRVEDLKAYIDSLVPVVRPTAQTRIKPNKIVTSIGICDSTLNDHMQL